MSGPQAASSTSEIGKPEMARMVSMISARPRTASRRTAAPACRDRRPEQPEQQRQVEQRVQDDALGRSKRQHDGAADRRADQHAEIARGGVEPHARSAGGPGRRCRKAATGSGSATARRRSRGSPAAPSRPRPTSVSVMKKISPPDGRDHEQQHAALDDAARVEAVGQAADGDGEQQKRQPVRHHRKARRAPVNGISGSTIQ